MCLEYPIPPLDYKQFEDYAFSLVHAIPYYVYEGIASIFCLGLVVFIAWKGFKTGLRYSAVLLQIEYIFLLFCSTVIFRPIGETRQYVLHPFWSYGRPDLLVENIMNAIVFIPVGMILGSLLKVKGSWAIALLIGCSISLTIEFLQFLFIKGFSEVDDVMHNTVGCLIGYGLVSGFRQITKAVSHLLKTFR